jgi:triosephosphate isomerase
MSQRPRLIVGNWKMHKTIPEAEDLVDRLIQLVGDRMEPQVSTVLAPPFTALSTVARAIKGHAYLLGAQNLHWEDRGAFTGEISGGMLRDVGCRYVLVGHSERRRYFAESDSIVQKKVAAALRHDLRPILCVGETWDHRQSGQMESVLSVQLAEGLGTTDKQHAQNVAIAYEPVWAIGSGRAATPQQAADAHRYIRITLLALWGDDAARRVPILYGGSVVPENIGELLEIADVNGALVGGACLDPVLFAKILRIATDVD